MQTAETNYKRIYGLTVKQIAERIMQREDHRCACNLFLLSALVFPSFRFLIFLSILFLFDLVLNCY